MEGARTLPQTNLRMPVDLKQWLQERATANRRSLNSEIVSRLEDSRKQEEASQQAA